jgi:hypothetical protein
MSPVSTETSQSREERRVHFVAFASDRSSRFVVLVPGHVRHSQVQMVATGKSFIFKAKRQISVRESECQLHQWWVGSTRLSGRLNQGFLTRRPVVGR